MKGHWFYIFVAFFLFEMTLPLCVDLATDLNIELTEAEKESKKEKESEKEEKKRRASKVMPGLSAYLSLKGKQICNGDLFRISENEFFELNDPPPER